MKFSLRTRSVPAVLKPAAAVIAITALTALTACSSGQITQTDTQETTVTGINTSIGDIKLLDAAVAALPDDQIVWEEGQDVPLMLTLINTGRVSDSLQNVSAQLADDVVLVPSAYSADSLNSDDETPEPTTAPPEVQTPEPTPSQSVTAPPDAQTPTPAQEQQPADDQRGGEKFERANLTLEPNEVVSLDGREQFLMLRNISKEITPQDAVDVTFHFDANGKRELQLPLDNPHTPRPRLTPETNAREDEH